MKAYKVQKFVEIYNIENLHFDSLFFTSTKILGISTKQNKALRL